MAHHGYTPDGFNIATIQPLVKKNKKKSVINQLFKRGSRNKSENYRPVSFCFKVICWYMFGMHVYILIHLLDKHVVTVHV